MEGVMLWDPLRVWTGERHWVWATLAVWIGLFLTPRFIESFRPERWNLSGRLPDFFQEWSSARSYADGFPIYGGLTDAAKRYVGGDVDPSRRLISFNAHPPTSVLLGLPLARLDFDTAFLAWNLASLPMLALSLRLVARGLKIPLDAWSVFPATVLILLCDPLYEQILQGQLNLVLLVLLSGAWAAERSGRPRLAGALLGAATAIKIFPVFLLAYFALRRQWQVVASGIVSLGVHTGLTVAVFGLETYRSYSRLVLPEIYWFRVCWGNNSAAGFWYRLFDPAPWKERTFSLSEPLWPSPALASAGHWGSVLVLVVISALSVRRSRSRGDDDRAFGLAITTMLLVTPICWDHYLVLLLIPLAVCWRDIKRAAPVGWVFGLVTLAIWSDPALVWRLAAGGDRVAGPGQNLTVLSYKFYALLVLFGLSVARLHQGDSSFPRSRLADIASLLTRAQAARRGTKRSVRGACSIVLLAFAASAVSALSLRFAPMPFVWMWLACSGALFGCIFCLRRSWPRALLFNGSVAAVVLAAAEAYALFHQAAAKKPPTYSAENGYFVPDDALGTVPARGAQARSTSSSAGRLIYDVTYTIGSNGLRVSPPVQKDSVTGSILFFGCSFTFGEGLEDDQTLPYQVGVQSGGRYATVNFGFHGYGPHQMLAAIQHGIVRRAVGSCPRYAIYGAIPHHVFRVAGKVPWGWHDPRYRLDTEGAAQRAGRFDDNAGPLAPARSQLGNLFRQTVSALRSSGLYHMVANREPSVSAGDVRLLLGVVRSSRERLVAEYLGLEFHVLLWPGRTDEIYQELRDGFRQLNIPVHLVADILPGYNDDPSRYAIPSDGHPNALANHLLAEYVLTRIIVREPGLLDSEKRPAARSVLRVSD
jgi:hypothetical protein